MKKQVRLVETRKIQRLGTSSLIVTLPKEWARRVGVKPGSLVQVISEGHVLKIIPVEGEARHGQSIRLSDIKEPDLISVAVNCLYMAGFDDITIDARGLDEGVLSELRRKSSSLLGVELLEDEDNVKVVVLLDDARIDVRSLLRAIGVIAGNTVRTALGVIEGRVGREEALAELDQLTRDLMSYQHTALRYLMKSLAGAAPAGGAYLALAVNVLGIINDRLVDAMKSVVEYSPMLTAEFRGALRPVLERLERLAPAIGAGLAQPGIKRLREVREAHEDLMRRARALLDAAKSKEDVVVSTKVSDVAAQLRLLVYGIACNLVYHLVAARGNGSSEAR